MPADGAPKAARPSEGADLASDLRAVARARVYFGRHSVGANMMDGLRQMAAEEGIDAIHVVQLDEESAPPGTVFGHSEVGENQDPRSKIEEFAEKIGGELPFEPDIAFMKFCYVDFTPDTDARDLFSHYRSTMSRLSEEHPHVRFLHTTVPLVTRTLGIKDRVRLVLGMPVWQDDANAKRHEFNRLIRETYDRDLIIDVAGVESTRPDGTRQQYTKDGKTYDSLVPAYTTDGGHLNDLGKRKVAAELVWVIARNVDAIGL
ncbi:MAG: hypothetical protein AMS21_00065 [Gemmatimonas sp. SG8_38_2]|nr:MAG: hypothetical protein AMS21_00065 [Gemmatimonas sp. SG8_38_2]